VLLCICDPRDWDPRVWVSVLVRVCACVSEARACGALWRERQSCCCVELHVEFTGTVSVAQQSSVGAQAGNPPSETPHWVRPETSSQSQRLEAPISSDVQEQCTILYYIGCCGVARALPKLHRLDSFAPNAQALCASSSGEGSCCTWLAYDGADFLEHARASIFFPSGAGGRMWGRSQKKAVFVEWHYVSPPHRLTAFRNRLSPPVGTLPRFRHSADRQTRHGHCVPPEPPLVQLDFLFFFGRCRSP